MSLLSTVMPYGIAAMGLALLMNAWRLLRGPGVPDRILALDTLYVNSLALMVLLGIHFNSKAYFEAALVVAMLGFIGTVALAKYLSRGDLIE